MDPRDRDITDRPGFDKPNAIGAPPPAAAPEDLEEILLEEVIHGNDPESDTWAASQRERLRAQRRARWRAARPRRRGPLARLSRRVFVRSDGFHFVLAFVGLVVSLGLLGYSLSLLHLELSLMTGALVLASGFWFYLRWVRWLDQTNYLHRLMQSLGENAENFLGTSTWRILRATFLLKRPHQRRADERADDS